MTVFTPADKLHRLIKQALDSGAAASIAEAEAMFAGYRVALRIDDACARDPHHQAALLTAVALARRVFLGGVSVSALPDTPLFVPLPFGRTLADAVRALGGSVGAPADGVPLIDIGGGSCARCGPFHMRALFTGWRGGIVPAHADILPTPAPVMPLAPMLAAGLAINEAFLFVSESTSVLSDAAMIGQKKTRAMTAWAERRGFVTAIHERLFDGSFRRQPDEPSVALCGLDNGLGRQALDQVGFDFVIEAGLGRGHRDFRAIRLHTLPASRSAAEIWRGDSAGDPVDDRPAYTRMLDNGELDRCGVALLAGKAVGAPFVGAVAATLAVTELLRLLHGGPIHELIDLDLESPDYRSAVMTQHDFSTLNPGYVLAGP
jgi:hypothetical protein